MTHIDATAQNFTEEVLNYKGKILVDFWAPWCGPCQMLSPVIDEIGDELKDQVKIVKVNVDEEPNISAQYNVNSIPTVLIFNNGQLRDTIVGFRQKGDYLKSLQNS
jgi:thioredoxin 1